MLDSDKECYVVEATCLTVQRGRVAVLRDVDLALTRGETVALMGPNGAGKSTLLKCLAGAVRPNRGAMRWFGNTAPRCPAVRRQIGFIGHECALYAELTALENLIFAARMYGVERPHERAGGLLAAAGLEQSAHRPAGKLSEGMRRRLAIARALIHQPPLILLDEPFASLDVDGHRWLEQFFPEWQCAGQTVCFASHDADQSRLLADRIVWLDGGRIAALEPFSGHLPTLLRSA